jgi:hypothetical protein
MDDLKFDGLTVKTPSSINPIDDIIISGRAYHSKLPIIIHRSASLTSDWIRGNEYAVVDAIDENSELVFVQRNVDDPDILHYDIPESGIFTDCLPRGVSYFSPVITTPAGKRHGVLLSKYIGSQCFTTNELSSSLAMVCNLKMGMRYDKGRASKILAYHFDVFPTKSMKLSEFVRKFASCPWTICKMAAAGESPVETHYETEQLAVTTKFADMDLLIRLLDTASTMFESSNIFLQTIIIKDILHKNGAMSFEDLIKNRSIAFIVYRFVHHVEFMTDNVGSLTFIGILKSIIDGKWKIEEEWNLVDIIPLIAQVD